MMTQRAKLRRLAFIDFPSWSRESRPLSFRTYPWVATRESPPRPHCNLGAARLAAKGTTPDYLAHPETIPVQKMKIEAAFSEVVKTPGGANSQKTVLFAALRGLLPPPRGRRLDPNPPLTDAHQRARQRLF